MAIFLVATQSGCRVFSDAGEGDNELAGRRFCALSSEAGGSCLAIIDEQEIWRRGATGAWARVATAATSLQSIASVRGTIFAGAANEASILQILPGRDPEQLTSFNDVPGRSEWFAGGPPLGVRAIAANADGGTILAAVHVGGIPRSTDEGATWVPTIPVMFDVHEVRTHSALANIVAAAAAAGLCISDDAGHNWSVLSEGLEGTTALALAFLQDEVLFSVQDGPFARRSQLWRWRMGSDAIEPVRDGLPEWLDGKIDTGHIASGNGRAAVVDGGGNLWLSATGSTGWKRIASDLSGASGLAIL